MRISQDARSRLLSAQPEISVEHDETALITRIRAGDRTQFHELIRPYERAVYSTAYGVLRNSADAEEVAQETMLKALVNLAQLRVGDKFKGWLLQIALNEARMRRRKDHRHLYESLADDNQENQESEFVPRQFADWRDIPSEVLEKKEIKQAVANALLALPVKYREVFLLRDVQHLNVEETGRILGISHPAVKTRLHRARMQMRELLAPTFQKRWTERLPLWKAKRPW